MEQFGIISLQIKNLTDFVLNSTKDTYKIETLFGYFDQETCSSRHIVGSPEGVAFFT